MSEKESVTLPHPAPTLSTSDRRQDRAATPPSPPTGWQEWGAWRLFAALSPRLPRVEQTDPPDLLVPFETKILSLRNRPGVLTATFFPAPGKPRGAVLLSHPWMEWGKSYFHRRGRIPALRAAGFSVLTFDLPGFGGSTPPRGFFDRDLDDAFDHLAELCPHRPLHFWGVSSGGYWAHPVLTRRGDVAGACFEDVSAHLLEWAWRQSPLLRPAFSTFRLLFPTAYRYLDLRRHAPHLKVRRAAYVSGGLDRGVRPEDTRELAALAGARHLVVPEAPHLGAIKLAPQEVIELALATFSEEI